MIWYDDHHHIFWPPQKQCILKQYWWSSFSRKKKRGQKIQGVKGVFLDHIIIHEGPLPPLFCPSLLSRATLKGCIISTVALSLSLSLARARKQQQLKAFFGRSTPKRRRLFNSCWSVSLPQSRRREREIPMRRKRYRLYTHKFDRSLFRIGPFWNALLWKPKRPKARAPPRKKKTRSDWHSHPYLLWDFLDALRTRRRRQSRRSHHHHPRKKVVVFFGRFDATLFFFCWTKGLLCRKIYMCVCMKCADFFSLLFSNWKKNAPGSTMRHISCIVYTLAY